MEAVLGSRGGRTGWRWAAPSTVTRPRRFK